MHEEGVLTLGYRAKAAGAHAVGLHKGLIALEVCGGVVAELHQHTKIVSKGMGHISGTLEH